MLKLEMPSVETKRLLLRKIQESDASDMFEYASDLKTIEWLTFPRHESVEDSLKVIQDFFLKRVENGIPSGYCLVLKENNKMIGTCDFAQILRFDSAEIGYVLNRQYWNQGYMSEACLKLIEMSFDYVGLRRLEILHSVHNIASQRVIEKCGFVYEGLKRKYAPNSKGEYYDHKCYSLLKEEYKRGEN